MSGPTEPGLVMVADFDALPEVAVGETLAPACASSRWITEIGRARPFGNLGALLSASDAVIADLDWVDLAEALAAHPRIGDRATGSDVESSWSRQEQSATAAVADTTKMRLRAANRAYEQRFGFVFLICATGKSAEDMLGAAVRRLQNEPLAEHEVVREELRQIVRLRLAKTFA